MSRALSLDPTNHACMRLIWTMGGTRHCANHLLRAEPLSIT
jgi:hypothetical protein